MFIRKFYKFWQKFSKNNVLDQKLIDALPGHIYLKDLSFHYVRCNYRQALALGFSDPDELIGKSDYDVSPKDKADRFREVDQNVIKTGKAKVAEEEVVSPDGQVSVMLSEKIPLKDKNGNVIGILGISMDITDRKKLEEELKEAKKAAEAASEAKSVFIANMAHDIRTPLTGSIGLSMELEKDADSEKDRERGRLLSGTLWQLSHLFDEVLESMRLEAGEIEDDLRVFNLRGLLNRNVMLQAPALKHKALKVEFNYPDTLPEIFKAPAHLLDRVILNLLANAVKFTETGKIAISVEANYPGIAISIQDTGIGIPKDKQSEIFGKFVRLTPSYNNKYKGAGLGLHSVKTYIETLGGEISVESEKERGSVFRITVPLEPIDNTEEAVLYSDIPFPKDILLPSEKTQPVSESKQTAQAAIPAEKGKRHILLVEDDPMAARMAQHMIEDLFDAHVTWADSGELGLAYATDNHYDLILTDIGMGEMDGKEMSERIRQLPGAKRNLPIVALTGHVNEETQRMYLNAGMNAVLNKPLTPEKAKEILDEFLESEQVDHSNQIIDIEASIKITGKKERTITALQMMSESIERDVFEIGKQFTSKDYQQMHKSVHKLKGALGYCGVPRLEAAVVALNQTLVEGDQNKFEDLDIEQMQREFETVRQETSAFLEAYFKLDKS